MAGALNTGGHDRTGAAVLFMLGSSLGFALMGASVRWAGDVPLVQKVFMRNVVMAALAGAWVARDGLPQPVWRWHPHSWRVVLRSLSGLLGVACYFYAIERLTLADATILNKLSPFFVMLFAARFLRERLTRPLVAALLVGFTGAMLVIKPRFDLSVIPALVGAASAVFAATAYTLVRSLKGLEPPHRIIFWFAAVSTLVAAPLALPVWAPPSGGQWLALLGIGLGAAAGQFGLTHGLQLAPASRISVLNYTNIVTAMAVGWFAWREFPDGWSLAGAALIIGAAVWSQTARS